MPPKLDYANDLRARIRQLEHNLDCDYYDWRDLCQKHEQQVDAWKEELERKIRLLELIEQEETGDDTRPETQDPA